MDTTLFGALKDRLFYLFWRPSAANRRAMSRRRWMQRWAHTGKPSDWYQGEEQHVYRVRARRRKERR